MDNILVAFEALHTMDIRLKGRNGFMAMKLDMSKSYNRIEWPYLEAIMQRLGFEACWVHLIMTFVRTVSYPVLVNGHPNRKIIHARGIKQGDSLSPYLFIFSAEGLSSLLLRVEWEGKITGLLIVRGEQRSTSCFSADDSVLFCIVNIQEWGNIQDVLKVYKGVSGQKLNRDKTSLYFSINTRQEAI
ncbi:uncharacterized mitochondrial protein AtMg01250-like [Corylus avellana]|uniref:uncharacterized mitochondrial protein AtMg01250-like n=1 Tax=Corylus avellana TaxID=13451 RepID=UPI00286C121C|nr:uncharacterized mitochondrial protein AtMg01250-like [Corylus avellana]